MNKNTHTFVEKLKLNPAVLGIILFWSWARGNERPWSDVDLVVILNEGYGRAVEKEGDQVFEIIYITSQGAFDFWNTNRDDAAGLWEVAKILYDRDGSVHVLAEKTRKILLEWKNDLDSKTLWRLRFDVEDQLVYADFIFPSDQTTAHMLLTDNVARLVELFFDVQKIWTPAPKQRIDAVRVLNPTLYALIQEFYSDGHNFYKKVTLAKSMIVCVFG